MPNFPDRPNYGPIGNSGPYVPQDNTGPVGQKVPNPLETLRKRMGNRGTQMQQPQQQQQQPFQRQFGPNYGGTGTFQQGAPLPPGWSTGGMNAGMKSAMGGINPLGGGINPMGGGGFNLGGLGQANPMQQQMPNPMGGGFLGRGFRPY